MNWKREIEVLTPLFNRGAYQDTPELRVPSIRGMVRWWFRALGGAPDEEKEVFGGMKRFGQNLQDTVKASRLVFRVSDFQASVASPPPLTLPHKAGNMGSPQAAFSPGARFRLEVFTRLGSMDKKLDEKATNALEAWLLLGGLGLRANRAGGSVWPAGADAPADPQEFRQRLQTCDCNWPVMLVESKETDSLDALRAAATDTVEGMPGVFGKARGGRQASSVKFKIVRFEDRLRLIVFARDKGILEQARSALTGHRSRPESWAEF